MSKSLRRWLLLLLAAGAIGLLLYRSRGAIGLEGFSWSRLWEVTSQAQWPYLLASVAVIFCAYAVRALRWMRFSRYLGHGNFASMYSATLIGFTGVFLLGRAGEPVRPLLIARKDGVPVASTFGIYVLERMFDIADTVVISGLSLLVFAPPSGGASQQALLTTARTAGSVLLVALLAMIGSLVYFRLHGAGALGRKMEEWKTRPGWHARAAGLFAGFGEGLQAIRTPADLAAAIFYTAAHWSIIILIYWLVPQAFGGRLATLGVSGGLMVLAFTMVGSAMQLPGVGGGAQLASFLALTAIFGVEKEPAAAVSIVLWLITFAAVSLAGVPLLIREGWSMGELRRLARAEKEAGATGTHATLPADSAPSSGARP